MALFVVALLTYITMSPGTESSPFQVEVIESQDASATSTKYVLTGRDADGVVTLALIGSDETISNVVFGVGGHSTSTQRLTDEQIGDKAFHNPPENLNTLQQSAVREAIGVQDSEPMSKVLFQTDTTTTRIATATTTLTLPSPKESHIYSRIDWAVFPCGLADCGSSKNAWTVGWMIFDGDTYAYQYNSRGNSGWARKIAGSIIGNDPDNPVPETFSPDIPDGRIILGPVTAWPTDWHIVYNPVTYQVSLVDGNASSTADTAPHIRQLLVTAIEQLAE